MSNDGYWKNRKDLQYYKKALQIMARVPAASVIDIGGWSGEFLHLVDSIEDKTCLDQREPEHRYPDVRYITANFLEFEPDRSYDLAICMQVLEHLDDDIVGPFAEKLFSLAPRVIISVPYQWEKGACKWHVQDPVDLDKLQCWTGRKAASHVIVKEEQIGA